LFLSSLNGHAQIVEMLLSNGAKTETSDKEGINAIVITAPDELVEVLRKLIQNEGTQAHNNILAALAQSAEGSLKAVSVKSGKDQNNLILSVDPKATALIRSSESGHTELIKLIPKRNSTIDINKKIRFTSLMAATLNGHTDIVKLLADKGAVPDVQNNDGVSALMLASQFGHADIVSTLLEKGANPHLKDNSNKTAADYANDAEVKLLLAR
jgi:serine/threonine-protein phosphatase 6 regulatory ankyrin repeat subunit B